MTDQPDAPPATAQATLTITVTAPNPVHAVRWAGHVRDLVHAEFDGSMRLHSFIELEPGGTDMTAPDDLTGAWTPDPPIGCLLPDAEPAPDQNQEP